jgi:hypothetical protein
MKKKRKWVVFGSSGLFILLGICLAYVTHGFLWSIHTPIYRQLLLSVPTPPGVLSDSGWTKLIPEEPCGQKSYKVDKEQVDLVSFYATELPKAGWRLMEHEDWKSQITGTPEKSFGYDKLVFTNNHRYWLSITVHTYTDSEGTQVQDSDVSLWICRDEEWKNLQP